MNSEIKFQQALIKIVGVFNYDIKRHIQTFIDNGYDSQPLIQLLDDIPDDKRSEMLKSTSSFYTNLYYKEFRGFLLTGENIKDHTGNERVSVKCLSRQKNKSLKLSFATKNNDVKFQITNEEIYFFPNGIGIFSLHLTPNDIQSSTISDLLNIARSFDSKVNVDKDSHPWHAWISKEILCGIPLAGTNAPSDEFSGSKFKTYCILDLAENQLSSTYNREHLLYEIATCTPLDSISSKTKNAPSDSFYSEIMSNKLDVYNNYTGLGILDSFTVIGQDNLNLQNTFSYNTFNKVYFSIYIFNLFIKYNLFKYNVEFLKDPIGYRDQFTTFLNNYNYHQISFNFLPNRIYENIRTGLMIDHEIEHFEKRLSNLANQIQEGQEKKQALLLGIISLITTIDALDSIVDTLNKAQIFLGWSSFAFYGLLVVIIITAGLTLLKYLYPTLFLKLKSKFVNEK